MNTPNDLKDLDQTSKVLLIVEAMNVLKNLLVRTYLIGYRFQNREALTRRYLKRVLESIISLVNQTGINIAALINDSKYYLTKEPNINVNDQGQIGATDWIGR